MKASWLRGILLLALLLAPVAVGAEESGERAGQARAHFALASSMHRRGDFAAAVEEYRKAIQLDGSVPAYHINLGSALESAGDRAGASAAYARALELSPNATFVYQRLGMLAYLDNDLSRAQNHFDRAIALEPANGEHYYNRGLVQYRREQYDAALASFQQARDHNFVNYQLYYNIGLTEFHREQLAAAVTAYQEALRLNAQDPMVHLNLGLAYRKQGNLDAAVHEYQTVLRLDPRAVSAHTNLGVVYRLQGKTEAAKNAYRAALAIDPENRAAKENLALLESPAALAAVTAPAPQPRMVPPAVAGRAETAAVATALPPLTARPVPVPAETRPVPVRVPPPVAPAETRSVAAVPVRAAVPPAAAAETRPATGLTADLERLQAEVAAANQRAVESLMQARQAQQQLTQMQAALNDPTRGPATPTAEELVRENIMLREQVARLREAGRTEAGAELETQRRDAAAARERAALLKEKLDQTLQELQNVYGSYREAERRELTATDELNRKLDELRTELTRAQMSSATSTERTQRLERELELLRATYGEKLTTLDAQVRETQQDAGQRVTDLTTEIARLQEQAQREHELYVAATAHIKQLEESVRGRWAQRVNLNTAAREALATIPALTERHIDNILWYRQNIGPFTSVDELQSVPGIDRRTYQDAVDYLEVVRPGAAQ
ncbi:MAG TPA: tetratricopeptide repeat protein [bacterium]|nr:tetratricopeptide repeat protein [bacterium]